MTTTTPRALPVLAVAFLFAGIAGAALAPPDAEVNPATGQIEAVDEMVGAGGADIRHTVDGGPGQPDTSIVLADDPAPDLDPRIAIGPDGKSWVVWWRDAAIDTVLLRWRGPDGSWMTELPISEPDEPSRSPEIVHDGSQIFVIWLIDDGEGQDIAVRSGSGPSPWPSRTVIHRTYYTGDADPDIHSSGGKLWVTWVESSDALGWSRYDYSTSTWSAPRFEPLGDGGRDAALARIAEQVQAD